jgi:Nuclease-related domain
MTETPTLSPWPAPTPADRAPRQTPATPEPIVPQVIDQPPQPRIAALLDTARRLSSRSERAARAALKEELKIGAELAALPAGWCVLASLDIECLDHQDPDDLHVDHVVIGPGGVFTIYVEHQPGAKVWVSEHAVTINGRESNRLRQARFEARRSSGAFTDACGFNVTVQSVLILIGAATIQTVSHPVEVHVRTQHDIRDWLCRQPPRLDSDMVRAIYDRVHGEQRSPSNRTNGVPE